MTAEESRPVVHPGWPSSEVLADLQDNYPTVLSGSPSDVFLTETDVINRIQASDTNFQVWRNGYERGLIEGATQQRLDDEMLADLAAQIAISRVENQANVRATIQNAIAMIDVMAAREARAKVIKNRGAA